MKPSDNDNKSSTDTTSGVERPIHLNPSQLLEVEADEAKAAITSVLQEMRKQLQAGADPKRLTREHPWIAVGTAAAAGLVGAMVAVPSKEDAALKRLARIERALHAGPAANGSAEPDAPGHPALKKFAARMFKVLRPTLMAAVTGALTGKGAQAASNADTAVDVDVECDVGGDENVVETPMDSPPSVT